MDRLLRVYGMTFFSKDRWCVWLGGLLVLTCFALPAQTAPREASVQVQVQVLDILTKQPLPHVHVQLKPLALEGLTDAQGRVSFRVTRHSRRFDVYTNRRGYLGTIETLRFATHDQRVIVAMPPLSRLEEADALIRAPKHGHVHQTGPLEPPSRPPTPAPLPNAIPIGPTYPVASTIKVLETRTGKTFTLTLEDYVKGVLPKEIGTSFPLESMKAQAVAARTYALHYTRNGSRSICNTTRCQVWSRTRYAITDRAVNETKSVVGLYNGKLIGGWFAASCGGKTRSNKDAGWSSVALPYLKGVTCIENRGSACRAVCNTSIKRNSTCWGIYGHRIGLCQRGAQSMGKCGKKYNEIVTHYYTGVQLANVATPPTPVNNASLTSESPQNGTVFQPGQKFTKKWVLKNTGNTTWTNTKGYALIRVSGVDLGAPARVLLSGSVSPRKSTELRVNMTTPTKAGTYSAQWQLEQKGQRFGPVLQVRIQSKANTPTCKDADKDGFFAQGPGCKAPFDCNDNDKAVNPGAKEICGNAKDDDCKGGDQACPAQCTDADKDGYFVKAKGCPGPYDCDDSNKEIYPGAKEVCGNNKDDDCQGGDIPCTSNCQDNDQDGYPAGASCPGAQDCNDNDKSVHPGAKEVCGNNKDDDCKGGDAVCPGPTNTKKKLGTTGCKDGNECESKVCAAYQSQTICSQRCQLKGDCPAGYQCLGQSFCWPSSVTTPGQCQVERDCQKGFVCKAGTCVEAKGCGCNTTRAADLTPSLWLLVLGLLFLRRRTASHTA